MTKKDYLSLSAESCKPQKKQPQKSNKQKSNKRKKSKRYKKTYNPYWGTYLKNCNKRRSTWWRNLTPEERAEYICRKSRAMGHPQYYDEVLKEQIEKDRKFHNSRTII